MPTHTVLSPSSSVLLFFPLLLLLVSIPLLVVTPAHSISLPASIRSAKKLNFEDCVADNECASPRTCLTRTRAGKILPCSAVTSAPLCMCAPITKVDECSSSNECSDGEQCAQIWFMSFATCVSCKSWLRLTRVLDTTGNSCAATSRQSITDNTVSRSNSILVGGNKVKAIPLPFPVKSVPSIARPAVRSVVAATKLNFEDCVADSECASPRTCLTRTRAGKILPCSAVTSAPLCMCAPIEKVDECSSSNECSDGEQCAQIWFMSFATCVSCKSWLRLTRVLDTTGNSCAATSRQSTRQSIPGKHVSKIIRSFIADNNNANTNTKSNAPPLRLPVNSVPSVLRLAAARSVTNAKKLNFEDCFADSECMSSRTCLTRTSAGQILPCSSIKPGSSVCMCAPIAGVPPCAGSHQCSNGERCAQIWFMKFATCVSCRSWLRLTHSMDNGNCEAPSSRQSFFMPAPAAGTNSNALHNTAGLSLLPGLASSKPSVVTSLTSSSLSPSVSEKTPLVVNLGLTGDVCKQHGVVTTVCRSPRMCAAPHIHPSVQCGAADANCYCGSGVGVKPTTGCVSSVQCDRGERCVQHLLVRHGALSMCASCTSPFINGIFRPVDQYVCPTVV